MPPDPTRIVDALRHMADHDRRRGARNALHVVVLGDPEAMETEAFDVPREIERVGKRLARATPSTIGERSRTDSRTC